MFHFVQLLRTSFYLLDCMLPDLNWSLLKYALNIFSMSQFILQNSLDLGSESKQGKYPTFLLFMWFPQNKSLALPVCRMQKSTRARNWYNEPKRKLPERLLNSSSKTWKTQTGNMPCVTNEDLFNESVRSPSFIILFLYFCTSSRSCQFIFESSTPWMLSSPFLPHSP